MNKTTLLSCGLGCLIVAGCDRRVPAAVDTSTTNTPMSLKLLDGVVARHISFQIGGEEIEATVFAKDLGNSALFVCRYPLPAVAESTQARAAAINAEIDRCVANVGAEVVSRQIAPEAEKTTGEIVAKSPQKRGHSIRSRVICTGKEIHSLTAISPESQDARYIQALDTMFKEFDAK